MDFGSSKRIRPYLSPRETAISIVVHDLLVHIDVSKREQTYTWIAVDHHYFGFCVPLLPRTIIGHPSVLGRKCHVYTVDMKLSIQRGVEHIPVVHFINC